MRGYSEKGKKLTQSVVEKKLRAAAEEKISEKYGTAKELRDLKEGLVSEDNHQLRSLARQLCELNDAFLKDRDVFAVCEKYPKGNLDTGRHYYSVYYVRPNGKAVDKIWGYNFYSLIGQESQDRDRSIPKFIYGSGVIGMSRLLDATDGLFTRLKSLGGCYAQIDCL